MALTYTNTRALHMAQTVPVNTPLPGTYIVGQSNSGVRPYGLAAGNIFENESGGVMKQHILMYNFNTRFSRKVSLFGNYQYNHSEDLPEASRIWSASIGFSSSVPLRLRWISASARL